MSSSILCSFSHLYQHAFQSGGHPMYLRLPSRVLYLYLVFRNKARSGYLGTLLIGNIHCFEVLDFGVRRKVVKSKGDGGFGEDDVKYKLWRRSYVHLTCFSACFNVSIVSDKGVSAY
ncbi:unnamed protein product [Arabis nemorensis]|uniref:Uncharacterized protein n=1 Tax=Arabis nemorensis TaxID=586526 RepID=A0A565BC67_9BRAS|nr:unnamed protein product [Arabis nemorensis]